MDEMEGLEEELDEEKDLEGDSSGPKKERSLSM